MLKKTTLSLMVSVLCMQQSLAGTGSSTPLKEEQGNQLQPVRRAVLAHRTTSLDDRDDDGETIVAGLAGLAIGSAVVYGLYTASERPKPLPKSSTQTRNSQDVVLKSTGRAASNLNSRNAAARTYEDKFSYPNENFSEEAWKKANGLPNSFSTPNSQRRYERPIYPERQIITESESNSNSYSETESSSDASEIISPLYKSCPFIDMSAYEVVLPEAAIDLHPVYNGNFKKHLRDEIFKRQLAYQRSETNEKKHYIITGTGRQRPGPNFILQNAVGKLLKEDYFWRRIAHYRLEKEGLFAIFLRKNKKIDTGK